VPVAVGDTDAVTNSVAVADVHAGGREPCRVRQREAVVDTGRDARARGSVRPSDSDADTDSECDTRPGESGGQEEVGGVVARATVRRRFGDASREWRCIVGAIRCAARLVRDC